MKKLRNALFGLICMTGLLSACGESPMAPSADVPLVGAEANWNGGNLQSDTTTTTQDPKGPDRTRSSGYILGMD